MNAEEIKDEIRKLSRTDKIEIYRWIDDEMAADLLSRIGAYRSVKIQPLAKGVRDLKKSWQPVLSPASLKAELERRKELSDTRSELERRSWRSDR